MKWVLIRHGMTLGNLEHRYVGCRSDEALCEQGRQALRQRRYPPVQRVLTSPLRRCIATAHLLYPHIALEIVDDFRECDFGEFEGKTYKELNGNEAYQRWVDSNGKAPLPGGESRAAFAARCVQAFDELIARRFREDTALIVHGGTIMAIMERYARPAGQYYDFQVPNGEGYILAENGAYTTIPEPNSLIQP